MPSQALTFALRCSLVLTLAAAAAGTHAGGAHQHGAAKLAVALDGAVLEISLESPLDNLLAFERAPRTEAERQAVRKMAQGFHAATGLFAPTPAAQCVPAGAELVSSVLDPALLAAAGSPGAADKADKATQAPQAANPPAAKPDDSHADLDATVRFRCAAPAALRGVDAAGLFKTFPKFRQVDAAVAAGSQQRGARLTPRQANLAW